MRTSCSLGSLLSIPEVLECAERIAPTNAEAVWIPETWGMECFSMMGAVASRTKSQKIGSSIINVYSRSPSAVAMGAATVDLLSGGRLVLGLGTSSVPIIGQFHGYGFDRPLQRMREYVEIVRLALSGDRIDYAGEIFNLENFTLLVKPQRRIPIYLAAVNQKMVELAWKVADGAILYLRPKEEMRQTVPRMQAKKRIDVACQIITCVADDAELAIGRAKKTISFYVAVGDVYREFLKKNGFGPECDAIHDAFRESGLESVHEHVSDSMAESLCIAGTPDECKRQLQKFRDAGVDLPILQFNPVGDVSESFELFRGALLE